MNGDRSDPRAFWERSGTSVPGTGPPAGAPPVGAPAAPAQPARPTPAGYPAGPAYPAAAPPPAFRQGPAPSGPPPRVGGAVAALVVAVCTLAIPVLGVSLGLWFFVLTANVPGVVLGILALVRIPDTAAVERYIRYTWACTFAYTALAVVFLVPVIALAVLFLLIGA
ncbi:hypothetical protein GCM10007079_15770 [Nocardiopsis terrae]|uniref:Uncharacterized protein n=1 Tax=Nocardiopsis terrae TaxID=372655 RepID=A0ABR9HB25_9ACTN|nr:hypothetical protein [Nocardiopsis terrae]MBE1456220.1 hypothetical protein [Nocardiopsis terrae]GHC78106.1 hypothetical protein GCM10007079_15770 [Nocardiopsis terrae]